MLSAKVRKGACTPPKRNRPFEIANPMTLGLVKNGPFWYSCDPESPFFLSFEGYKVLETMLGFYDDPTNLLKFHRVRSEDNLRYYLNFHIVHCKQHQVMQDDAFMVDFNSEYRAMQRRFTRDWFDEFNRGPHVLLFDAPDEVVAHYRATQMGRRAQGSKQGLGDELGADPSTEPECGSGPAAAHSGQTGGGGGGGRIMLCAAVRQLNYFHWILSSGRFDVMCEREPLLHPTLNAFVKKHKENKSRLNLHTRQRLCTRARGPVVVERPGVFMLRM